MAVFYRGAGIGTYWHTRDARTNGFTPKSGGTLPSLDRLVQHIARGIVDSPYVSLTRSYGVAHDYAVFGRNIPDDVNPAYVYEVEIDDPPPQGLNVLDPVKEISINIPDPLNQISYHHDGDMNFLLGVVSPTMSNYLQNPVRQPPPSSGTVRTANLSQELEALVRTLRDAEILAVGNMPASCVRTRHRVW